MIGVIDKGVVKNNFSKYAKYYDKHADIQRNLAQQLISRLEKASFKMVLDIGCGTGIYTGFLRTQFPLASIKAVDISSDMIEIARRKMPDEMTEFVVGDAETIDFKEKFDLITSNATFQWFTDLGNTLARYETFLNNKGIIAFSTFGPSTFYELSESLKELFGESSFISAHNFTGERDLKNILKNLFNKVSVEQSIYKEIYRSLRELLKRIKYSGIRGYGANRKTIWVPGAMDKLERIYLEKFKSISATYEVLFCKGEK